MTDINVEFIPPARDLPPMTEAEFEGIKARCGAAGYHGDMTLGFSRARNDAAALLRKVERLQVIIQLILDKCVDRFVDNKHNVYVYLWEKDWIEFERQANTEGIEVAKEK